MCPCWISRDRLPLEAKAARATVRTSNQSPFAGSAMKPERRVLALAAGWTEDTMAERIVVLRTENTISFVADSSRGAR